MATYEEVMRALRNADKAGDTAAASRLAKIADGLKGQPQEPTGTGMGFLNRGIATGLGGPVDLANAALGMVGLDSQEPFLGSKSIGRMMGATGVDVAPEGAKPTGIGGYAARGIGETAGALVPGSYLMRILGAGTGALGAAGRAVTESQVAHPVASIASELGAGATAGAGGGVAAQSFPGNPAAEALGELGGGVTAGAAGVAAKLTPTVTGLRLAKKAIIPFTKAGAIPRAERRAQELAADATQAGKNISTPRIATLSPAQRSDEKKLMAAERYIADQNPAFAEKLAKQQDKATGQLKLALRELGGDATLADTYTAIGPAALKKARAQERALWSQVPLEAQVETKNTFGAFRKAMLDTPRAQQDDIPEEAKRLLTEGVNDGFKDVESVQELQGLRSKLLEISRAAGKSGNFNKRRIADNLAEAILQDLEAGGEGVPQLKSALAYSRQLNEKFTRTNKATLTNPVGKSFTRQFIDAPDIETIVKSRQPRDFAAAVKADALEADPSGRALTGLQAGAVDYLIKQGSRGLNMETGEAFLSGAAMRKAFNEPATKAALVELLPPEKLERLDKVITELSILDRARGRLPGIGGGLVNDTPNSVLSLMVRTIAARHGAKMGQGTSGASLLTAGFFSKRAQQLLGNLTRDKAEAMLTEALTNDNPELLQALLTNTTTRLGQKIAAQRLNAWLAQPAFSYLDDSGQKKDDKGLVVDVIRFKGVQ